MSTPQEPSTDAQRTHKLRNIMSQFKRQCDRILRRKKQSEQPAGDQAGLIQPGSEATPANRQGQSRAQSSNAGPSARTRSTSVPGPSGRRASNDSTTSSVALSIYRREIRLARQQAKARERNHQEVVEHYAPYLRAPAMEYYAPALEDMQPTRQPTARA